ALLAALAGHGQALPSVAGALAGITAARDKRAAVVSDNVEFLILCLATECATHTRRLGIAAGQREANPMAAAWLLRSVTQRLIGRAVVGNDLRLIGHALWLPRLDDWKLAGRARRTRFPWRARWP